MKQIISTRATCKTTNIILYALKHKIKYVLLDKPIIGKIRLEELGIKDCDIEFLPYNKIDNIKNEKFVIDDMQNFLADRYKNLECISITLELSQEYLAI